MFGLIYLKYIYTLLEGIEVTKTTFSNGIFYHFKFCHNRKKMLLMAVATTIMVVTSIFKTFAYLSEQSTRLFHDFHEMANPYIHTAVTLCKNPFKINSKMEYFIFYIDTTLTKFLVMFGVR